MVDQDDIQHLRDNPHLLQLLTHYAELGQHDRKTWHDRLMAIDGLDAGQITRLHGVLLAFEWIEQDTGAARASYRITPAGIRSLTQAIHGGEGDVMDEAPPPRKKRTRTESRPEQSTPAAA
jgi:hypothetical protein